MRSITVYHGSSRPDVVPNHEKILYVTPDTRYNYIQHSEYTYRASFKSQTPYLTDNQSFVEALRSNPERIQVLRDMGYDAVLYSSPNDLSSGAIPTSFLTGHYQKNRFRINQGRQLLFA